MFKIEQLESPRVLSLFDVNTFSLLVFRVGNYLYLRAINSAGDGML